MWVPPALRLLAVLAAAAVEAAAPASSAAAPLPAHHRLRRKSAAAAAPPLPSRSDGKAAVATARAGVPAPRLKPVHLHAGHGHALVLHWHKQRHKDPSCADEPAGWQDSEGFTCEHYASSGFCTDSGAFGENWIADWGSFENFANVGHAANTACCSCGGGHRAALEEEPAEAAAEAPAKEAEAPSAVEELEASVEAPAPTAVPPACFDYPPKWKDSDGWNCQHYTDFKFCTADGKYGNGWWGFWGTFKDYAQQGLTGDQVCCGCGGGKLEVCTGACKEEESWAVKLVREKSMELEGEVKAKVGEAAEQVSAAAGADMRKKMDSASGKLEHFSTEVRDVALETAKERFDRLTAGHEKLVDSAKQKLVTVGNLVARQAGADAAALLRGSGLRASAEEVQRSFQDAASLWGMARDYGASASQRGWREWRGSYRDVNQTWEAVDRSIRVVNTVASDMVEPFSSVRWGKQAVRLSSDLAGMARSHAAELDVHVASAQEQANKAMHVTQANGELLEELEVETAATERDLKLAEAASVR